MQSAKQIDNQPVKQSALHVAIDCRKAADLGIGRYVTQLTHELVRLAPEVRFTLLASPASASLLPIQATEIRLTDVGHYRLHEPHSIGRLIDDIAPDVFHAPHYVYPVTRAPGVVTIHDLIHLGLAGLSRFPQRAYARLMISRAIRDSQAVLTVSGSSAAAILREWPEAGDRLHVIHNGVDERFFEIRRSPDELRPFLLVLGNDKPHKNLDRLLDAWAGLQASNVRLVIAGGSPERFRGTAGVELRGHVTDQELVTLMSATTGLVFPSTSEGFGLPVLEAMAAGVPVAASSIGPVDEVAGDTIIRFDPWDVDAIRSALRQLLAEKSGANSRLHAARQRASRFRWESTARATLRIYESVAAQAR